MHTALGYMEGTERWYAQTLIVQFKHLKYITVLTILSVISWFLYTWIAKVCLKIDPSLNLRRRAHIPPFLKARRSVYLNFLFVVIIIIFLLHYCFGRAQFRR